MSPILPPKGRPASSPGVEAPGFSKVEVDKRFWSGRIYILFFMWIVLFALVASIFVMPVVLQIPSAPGQKQ
jgi:hypothetical protein